MVAGAILVWEGDILLCKRAIEPRHGRWTLPAGFMENHESLQDCAQRECREEAHAKCTDMKLFSLHSLPHISQMYAIFHGTLEGGWAAPGEESLETALVPPKDIPWDDLAFDIIRTNLELFLEHGSGNGQVHTGVVSPHPGIGPQGEPSA